MVKETKPIQKSFKKAVSETGKTTEFKMLEIPFEIPEPHYPKFLERINVSRDGDDGE